MLALLSCCFPSVRRLIHDNDMNKQYISAIKRDEFTLHVGILESNIRRDEALIFAFKLGIETNELFKRDIESSRKFEKDIQDIKQSIRITHERISCLVHCRINRLMFQKLIGFEEACEIVLGEINEVSIYDGTFIAELCGITMDCKQIREIDQIEKAKREEQREAEEEQREKNRKEQREAEEAEEKKRKEQREAERAKRKFVEEHREEQHETEQQHEAEQ